MSSRPSHFELSGKVDALTREGRGQEAIAFLKSALKDQPEYFQGWLRLSKLLFDAQQFDEAVQVNRAAERFDPLHSEFQSIQRLMQNRSIDQADQVAREMLSKQPGHPRAIFTLAEVARLKNYPEGRVAALQHGLEHSPANMMLRSLSIRAFEEAGKFAEAITAARVLVRTQESAESLWSLITVLLRHGEHAELLDVCERAKRLCENDSNRLSDIELVRGQTLRVLGDREKSISAYRACLALNPKNAGAWWAIADMKTYRFSDADRMAIGDLLERPDIPQADKCIATFALAKASENGGDWDETMSLYSAANRLHPPTLFDPARFEREISARIAALSPETLAGQADQDPEGPTPIFILGLPRAGSTLIEQILASHSQIEGTIEQPVFPSIVRRAHMICALQHRGTLLSHMGDLSVSELRELGSGYISDGALFRNTQSPFFTDKLPFNFLNIGLIHKVLPRSVIIDARRNPMDCGLSLYKQHFPTGVDFSYDLGHIGAFYTGYLRLLDHLETVLPGRVLTVQHEDLVRSPELHIRRLLDHVGVDFEPACVNFHETERAIRTASSEQVRQPINTRGIGAWRKVEAHLEPLKQSLGAATLARFEGQFDP